MWALHPKNVLETVAASGINVSLTAEKGLLVTPASALTADLREMLKAHKSELVEYLQRHAANDPGEAEREMIEERAAIMEFEGDMERTKAERLAKLHTDYLIHHWRCKTCCAFGQKRGEQRCDIGAELWAAYDMEASSE